jgi:hypothetical protein
MLKTQASDISQGLDKVFGTPQPKVVVPAEEAPKSEAVVVPKRFKDKIRLVDQILETTGKVALRTNLLTRIYSHMQAKKVVNVNTAGK